MPVSLSPLRYFGMPNGIKIVRLIASIISGVDLSFKGYNCIYPVNMSTAKNMALCPFSVGVKDGIKSTAHEVRGALTKSISLKLF